MQSIFAVMGSREAFLYYWIGIGSLFIYVYSRSTMPSTSHPVIKRLVPGRGDVFYDWADFILTMAFGIAIGHAIFDPQNTLQALAAGMTWPASAVSMTKGRVATAAKPQAAKLRPKTSNAPKRRR